jgi:PEP-CTERM motif
MKTTKNTPKKRFAIGGSLIIAAAATLAPAALALPVHYSTNGPGISAASYIIVGETASPALAESGIGWIWQAPDGATQTANLTKMYGMIQTAFNGGDWLGTTGITSQWAIADAQINGVLGVMLYDNTQIGFTSFQGKANLDTIPDANLNQVMCRLTYSGDFNGDGKLDGGDYALQDYYLGSSLTMQGDLNFDGIINGGDFALMDYIIGAPAYGLLAGAAAFSGSPVPEPTSGILMMFGAACIAGWRRRKSSN